ncbi:MAG: Ger(x)C family spore germination C-terminal domain-containing protein [Christensenellales bacterium]|nr:Ger(x)C family spore germination C-terminal domain-containing protein [Christensenellales bacterium]
MRKGILSLILCLMVAVLSGCSEYRQVENLAFALIMGLDLTSDGNLELSVVVPSIQSGDQSSEGPESSQNELLYTAEGENFTDALYQLKWNVPRRLDLSQIELFVVSAALAESPLFSATTDAMMGTAGLYTSGKLAICHESVTNFISAIRPAAVDNLSAGLTAMFEDYTTLGFIPDTSFADFYYDSISIFSDPIAVRASLSQPDRETSGNPVIPDPAKIQRQEDEATAQFLGAAVFSEGVYAGDLSVTELLYCNLIRGERLSLPFYIDGQTVYLTTDGTPKVSIDSTRSPVRIRVELRFSLWHGGQSVNIPSLEEALSQDLSRTVDVCKALNSEPFRFAEKAASSFPTLQDFLRFDWNSQFSQSQVSFEIHFIPENS